MKKENERLLQKFKRCIDERALEAMDNNLYCYLNTNCSFIAHYDISGFKHFYQGERFLQFIDHFINPPFGLPLTYPGQDESQKEINAINEAMTNYVKKNVKRIHFEFENKAYAEKIKMLKQLAEEVGYEVKPKDAKNAMDLELTVNDDGQLSII